MFCSISATSSNAEESYYQNHINSQTDVMDDPSLKQEFTLCTHDESFNFYGPGRCVDASECTGDRVCSVGRRCEGESNCIPLTCDVMEEENRLGPGKCNFNSECAGNRVCSIEHECEGISGCPVGCDINETHFYDGTSLCGSDAVCKGNRKCGWRGKCLGDSGC